MKSCVAIRHVAFEDLDMFGMVLRDHGYDIRYVDAPVEDMSDLDPLAADLLVVLGGPIGAYDEAMFPCLNQEFKLVERRLAADRPLIGFCLGAQIMARVLGGRVYANPNGPEMGWSPVTLTADGRGSVLNGLADVPVLHWHGDTFDLPQGAIRLASTQKTLNQAFSYGRNALGLQFHAEVSGLGLERWFLGNVFEISRTPGISVPQLRADTAEHSPKIERIGTKVLGQWLEGLST